MRTLLLTALAQSRRAAGQPFRRMSTTTLSTWEIAAKQVKENWALAVLGGSISAVGFFIKYEVSRIDTSIEGTNKRIDQTNVHIDDVRKELSSDIKDTNKRIDNLAEKVDQLKDLIVQQIQQKKSSWW